MGMLLVDVISPLGVIGITTSRTSGVVAPCGETGGEPQLPLLTYDFLRTSSDEWPRWRFGAADAERTSDHRTLASSWAHDQRPVNRTSSRDHRMGAPVSIR